MVNYRVPTDQYHMTVSRAQMSTHRDCVFLKLSADKLLVLYMHGYKAIALALAKSIYYSHRIEMVGEFERAKDDVKMCKATLFEICSVNGCD